MVTIGKNVPQFKPSGTKVDIDRRCGNCACINEKKDWCQLHKHTTSEIKYACKSWLTKEQLEKKKRDAEAYIESRDGIRVEYMLTLMFAFISASYHIMTRSEAILGELIGGKEWRFERKKALKDMMSDIKHISTLYSTYFEKDYIQMMSNYGREDFDKKKYDGFQMYSGDILMVGLTLMEHCYHNNALIHEIIEEIRQRPNDLNLFTPEFVEQFKIR